MKSKGISETKLIEQAAREFARKELAPAREENDHYPFGPFFQPALEKAFALDFFHLTLPPELGGVGHGIRELCLVLDAICQADSSLGGIIFTHTLAQEVLLAAGEMERLRRRAEEADTVERFLLAFPALDHPGETPLPLKARREGGAYQVNGTVEYVVLGGLAGHALLPAAMDDSREVSFFLVDLKDGGISRSEPILSHGLHACPAVDLTLDRVPAALVGQTDQGRHYFQNIYPPMQLAAAAMASGIMKGAFQEALSYCRERRQGGRRLKDWSLMQMKLADMSIQVQVADLLIAKACEAVLEQDPGWRARVQSAALHVLTAAPNLATDGIQALGGVGYMKDFGQEKRFRDAGQVQALLGLFPMKKIRMAREFLGNGKP